MARDRTKNAYITISLPLDSETLQALRSDSQQTGVSIPQLLAVRITDWYQFAKDRTSAAPLHPGPVPQREKTPLRTVDHASERANGLRTRAAAAAVAWGEQEEEGEAT